MEQETFDMGDEMIIISSEEIGEKKYRCLVKFLNYTENKKMLNHFFSNKMAYLTITYNEDNIAKISDIELEKFVPSKIPFKMTKNPKLLNYYEAQNIK